ncbi:uncharacterized protein LOC135492282 [Lineus longissimus]|uniref:uncharacterized protein LOC135492282 n=1 Tax=Lineus longissimus TaxID=88925 RepID=UPI002B4F9587
MDSRYIMGVCLLAIVLPAVVMSAPAKVKKRSASSFLQSNPVETIAVLDELIKFIKENFVYDELDKRGGLGAGYGSRFSAANNYGSKLMALHAASDSSSPGRKRRQAIAKDDQ